MMKRTASMAMALALGVWLSASPAPAAPKGDAQTTVTFLAFNDVYESMPSKTNGGILGMAKLLERARAAHPNAVTVVAGDFVSPSVMTNTVKSNKAALPGGVAGSHMVDLFKLIGVNIVTLGNHEFDTGGKALQANIDTSAGGARDKTKFVWLAGNIEGLSKTQRTYVMDFDGLKVGFFGLTLKTPGGSFPDGDNYIKPAKARVAELRAQGVDAIVAVTHLPVAADKALARGVLDEKTGEPAIHLILGGHEHIPYIIWCSKYACGEKKPQGLRHVTPIFKLGEDAELLGIVTLKIAKRGDESEVGVLKLTSETNGPGAVDMGRLDPQKLEEIQDRIRSVEETTRFFDEEYRTAEFIDINNSDLPAADKKFLLSNDNPERKIGVVGPVSWDLSEVRKGYSAIASDVCAAMRKSAGTAAGQAVDLCLVSAGGFRGERAEEPGAALTNKRVWEMLPFGNNLVVVSDVTRDDLVAMINQGLACMPEPCGQFPQGIPFQYRYERDAKGQRKAVVIPDSIRVNGQPIDPRRKYNLVTIDYLANSEKGDGYAPLMRDKPKKNLKSLDQRLEYVRHLLESQRANKGYVNLPQRTPDTDIAERR